MISNSNLKNHAQKFISIVNGANLSRPQELLDLYAIDPSDTWDIVALLGACEGRLDESYQRVIRSFREMIIRYVVTGEEPWPAWTEGEGKIMIVGKDGLRVVGRDE